MVEPAPEPVSEPEPAPTTEADGGPDAGGVAVEQAAPVVGTQAARTSPDALGRGRPRSRTLDDNKQRSTTISIPYDLRERLKVRAGAVGVAHARIIMDAVEATYPDLPRLVAEHRARESSPGEVPANGLFPRREERREAGGQHKVPIGLHMTTAELDVLDRVVHEVGAESRSQLCWVALAEHLAEG